MDYWISTIARDTVVQQSQVMWGSSEKRRAFGIGCGRCQCLAFVVGGQGKQIVGYTLYYCLLRHDIVGFGLMALEE